jgi:hypothetical protein
MSPLSPIRLISAATAFLGLGEESAGTGVGRLVSLCLAEVGQPPGHPWDAAFVHHVGYWSHYENEVDHSAWPLPRTATAGSLARFAEEKQIVHDTPELGDIAVVAGAKKGTIARVGIVVRCRGVRRSWDGVTAACTTIEGNAGPSGRPGGTTIMRVNRELSFARGDRFVRWVDLDRRHAFGSVLQDQLMRAGQYTVRRAA